jgi:hypothetical protein
MPPAVIEGRRFRLVRKQDNTTVLQLIEGISDSTPQWDGVALKTIALVNFNSPVTMAVDAAYSEEVRYDAYKERGIVLRYDIGARVDTYIRNGVMQQHIRVTLTTQPPDGDPAGTDYLGALATWYDELRTGGHNHLAHVPVKIPNQPAIADARRADKQ